MINVAIHINIKSPAFLSILIFDSCSQSSYQISGFCFAPDFRIAAGFGIVDETILWPEKVLDYFFLIGRLIRLMLFVLR